MEISCCSYTSIGGKICCSCLATLSPTPSPNRQEEVEEEKNWFIKNMGFIGLLFGLIVMCFFVRHGSLCKRAQFSKAENTHIRELVDLATDSRITDSQRDIMIKGTFVQEGMRESMMEHGRGKRKSTMGGGRGRGVPGRGGRGRGRGRDRGRGGRGKSPPDRRATTTSSTAVKNPMNEDVGEAEERQTWSPENPPPPPKREEYIRHFSIEQQMPYWENARTGGTSWDAPEDGVVKGGGARESGGIERVKEEEEEEDGSSSDDFDSDDGEEDVKPPPPKQKVEGDNDGWVPLTTETGQVYWFHEHTHKVTWTDPT